MHWAYTSQVNRSRLAPTRPKLTTPPWLGRTGGPLGSDFSVRLTLSQSRTDPVHRGSRSGWSTIPAGHPMLCRSCGQPHGSACSPSAGSKVAGCWLGWAREDCGESSLLGLPCGEEVGEEGTEIVIKRTLKDNMPCILYPSRLPCCCTVCTETLVTWDTCRPEPAQLLCTPMHACAQLCHGNSAFPLPNLR